MHETVPQENAQPSTLECGNPHQQLQPSDPHAVEGQHGPTVCRRVFSGNCPARHWLRDQGREEQHAGTLAGGLLSLLRIQQAVLVRCTQLALQGVRPAISFSETTFVASPRPSSGSMCRGHIRGKGDSSITPSSWKRGRTIPIPRTSLRTTWSTHSTLTDQTIWRMFAPTSLSPSTLSLESTKTAASRSTRFTIPAKRKTTLLLLFVPFRNEGDLIEEGETAESALNRHMEENGALNTHSEKLQRMLKAKESVQKINEARQAQQQDVKGPDQGEEDDDDDVGRQVKPRRPCTMCWNSIRVSSLSSVCTKG